MGKPRFGALFSSVIIFVLSLPLSVAGSTIQKTKQWGEPRPDKALVYAVRESAIVGRAVGMFVFADEQLIAFLRNGTYSFAYIDPGQHMIWGDTDSALDIHLVAGETYYISAHVAGPITLLTEGDGKAAIDGVGAYIQNDATDVENGAKRVARRYEKVRKREARKEKPAVEQLPADTAAPATEGSLKLAANTKLSIELMENLSSALNTAGQTVWLRVAEDVASDGKVVIPRGTPVKAMLRQVQHGSSHGAPGTFNATFVSIDLDATHRIPVVGEVSSSGRQRTAGAVSGGLMGLLIMGTEAFEAAGSHYPAWIRDNTWLEATSATPAAASAPATTAAPVEISFGANTRSELPPVRLSFPCAAEVPVVQLVSIGDWALSEPVKSLTAAREGEACIADFDGWSLLRHVHPGPGRQMLHLLGRSGADEIHIDVPVNVRVD
jgi:hypothetical protein